MIPSDFIYMPREDDIVLEELKNNQLPRELKEQLQLIEPYSPLIEEKIVLILEKIIKKNQLDISIPQICISGDKNINASMISCRQTPILTLTKGLLQNIQSEDELAGILAHELAHLVIHKHHPEIKRQSKIEETTADNLAVNYLYQAGYDPKGLIYFFENGGVEGGNLITIDDIQKAGSLDESGQLLQSLIDPHPSDLARIRSMTTCITALEREGKISHIPPTTLLDLSFKNEIKTLFYESPIEAGLRKVNYNAQSTLEKLTTLTYLLNIIYPPENTTSAERLPEITAYIQQLSVNFNNEEESEAFKKLTDVVMGYKLFNSKRVPVFPKNTSIGNSISGNIGNAFKKIWEHGGKDPNYLARNEDLNKAAEAFFKANTKEQAEEAAQQIVALCEKISPSYRDRNFKGFYVPSIKAIENNIASQGSWVPPYSQHVLWCAEPNSEQIRKILLGMNLGQDPWAASILGEAKEGDEYRYGFYIAKEEDIFWENYKLFTLFSRENNGTATRAFTQVPAYPWKFFNAQTSFNALKIYHQQETEHKQKYEEEIIRNTDWSQVQKNFPQFILQYGNLLNHYKTITPVSAPFAKKFFEELIAFLPQADENYKAQLKDFFRHYRDDATPYNEATILRHYELYPENNNWIYEAIPEPSYWAINNPFIQFLLNPLSSTIITDYSKISCLKNSEGFLAPNPNKKLQDIFPISIKSVLLCYPQQIKTIADLDQARQIEPAYHPLTLALEAERLAYEYENSLSMEEFVTLNTLQNALEDEKEYVSNINEFFIQLKYKTVQRHFNTSDCAELIKHYRYAVAHHLIQGESSLYTTAYSKIKTQLPKLPIQEQLELLSALLKPETITPRDKSSYFDWDKKYDGYIPDPEFRNWLIDQLTTLWSNQLGLDNGTSSYLDKVKPVIKDIEKNTSGLTQLNILSSLATKINAQKEVAYLFRDTYNTKSTTEILSKVYEGIVIELLVNESSKDAVLRQHLLNFLAQPLTDSSPNPLSDYLQTKYDYQLKHTHKKVIHEQLRDFYKNFKASSLPLQTVYLEPLLFPLNSTEQEQLALIKKLIDDSFPQKSAAKRSKNEIIQNTYAQQIMQAYLDAAELPERRLLTTALFISTMKEHDSAEITIGQKLNKILSHMGPAGGKLLQAIHSHPQTPNDLKKDIASSKTLFDPPLRWELVEYVDKNGLLDIKEDNPNPVTYIGSLVGSGSFGLTVFNTLQDNTQVADTFLRERAAIKAERELNMMHHAATNLVKSTPELKPIINIVEEAKRSAQSETDMKIAEKANLHAEHSYHHVKVLVGSYQFTHEVTTLQKIGDNFKRANIASGEHFNDLENSPYKSALAKAMVVTQLTLRLAGFPTDLDRHGGNVKIKDNQIAHFDFGAMNIEPITQEDKLITGKILAKTLFAVQGGEDFSEAFLNSIHTAQVSPKVRTYLNGLNKDFLALGDYLQFIDKKELESLIASCLIAKTVDPQITAVIKKELGWFYPAFVAKLQSKAKECDTSILLNEHFKLNKQSEITFYQQQAEYLIRFSDLKQLHFHRLTEEGASRLNDQFIQLLYKIDTLEHYGRELKNNGSNRGNKAINLAIHLRNEVYSYLNGVEKKEEATIKIHALINQGKRIMREDRKALDIFAHILLALTGVGLIPMLVQKYQTGTFFLNKTKREHLVSNIEEELKNLPPLKN